MKNVISKLMMVAGFITLAAACSEPDPVPEQVQIANTKVPACNQNPVDLYIGVKFVPDHDLVIEEWSLNLFSFEATDPSTPKLVKAYACSEYELEPNRQDRVLTKTTAMTTDGTEYFGQKILKNEPYNISVGGCQLSSADSLPDELGVNQVSLETNDVVTGSNCQGIWNTLTLSLLGNNTEEPAAVLKRQDGLATVVASFVDGVAKVVLEAGVSYLANFAQNIDDADDADSLGLVGVMDEDTGLASFTALPGFQLVADYYTFTNKDRKYVTEDLVGWAVNSTTEGVEFMPPEERAKPDGEEQMFVVVIFDNAVTNPTISCTVRSGYPATLKELQPSNQDGNDHVFFETFPDVSMPFEGTCEVPGHSTDEYVMYIEYEQVPGDGTLVNVTMDSYGDTVVQKSEHTCVFTPYERLNSELSFVLHNYKRVYKSLLFNEQQDGTYTVTFEAPDGGRFQVHSSYDGGLSPIIEMQGVPTLNTPTTLSYKGELRCDGTDVLTTVQFMHQAFYTLEFTAGGTMGWVVNQNNGLSFQ